jgi:adenylate kinase family enzyme
MKDSSRIHIFGASGSGTTTLGSALASELGICHLDTDDYYWQLTEPPFIEKNAPSDRIKNIRLDTTDLDGWVLTGSLCSWGDPLLPEFTLAVFLSLDPNIRMRRLLARERQRYGSRIDTGGDMYQQHLEFIAWAESYDYAQTPIRSFDLHSRWSQKLRCPVLRLNSELPVKDLIEEIASVAS